MDGFKGKIEQENSLESCTHLALPHFNKEAILPGPFSFIIKFIYVQNIYPKRRVIFATQGIHTS